MAKNKKNENLNSTGLALTGASAGIIGSGVKLAANAPVVAGALAATGISVAASEATVAVAATALVGAGIAAGTIGVATIVGAAAYGVYQLTQEENPA